jgi:hypothetical protein
MLLMNRSRARLALLASTFAAPLAARPAAGQAAATAVPALAAEASGRATATVLLRRPRAAQGTPRPSLRPADPARVSIDYGQPHARGRKVLGGLVPLDTVWRTGANAATTLTTDVDLAFGATRVPWGTYTLFSRASQGRYELIVNKQTGQWGTIYDSKQDLVRIPLRARTLAEPVESFTIWLVPSTDDPTRGVLRMAWGTLELSADWQAAP